MASARPQPAAATRAQVIGGILNFLSGQDLLAIAEIRQALEREIDEAGPDALVALRDRLTSEAGWGYYAPDPLARRIHHVLADRFLEADSQVLGFQHIDSVMSTPVAIFSNHLSYADANVIDVLLERSGAASLARRLTAVAGPKVFSSRERRFSSLCFGTIKVPQSAEVSSEEAVLNPRDVARAARQSIDAARERLRHGDALVLFGEGTRSRTGAMHALLAGVARYLDGADAWVLPVGLTGSEALFPLGDATIHPSRATLRIGQPFRAETLLAAARGDRRLAMDVVGVALAELLPPSYRGVYGQDHEDAKRIHDELIGQST
jgi:1-acyl-sn-glycerol-3-phosphate acyltransferase